MLPPTPTHRHHHSVFCRLRPFSSLYHCFLCWEFSCALPWSLVVPSGRVIIVHSGSGIVGLCDGHTVSTLNESMLPTQGRVQPDDLTTQGSLVDWVRVSVWEAQAPSSTRNHLCGAKRLV